MRSPPQLALGLLVIHARVGRLQVLQGARLDVEVFIQDPVYARLAAACGRPRRSVSHQATPAIADDPSAK